MTYDDEANHRHAMRGRTILLLEYVPLIAFDLEDLLVSGGGRVLGPASTVARAMEIIDQATVIDAALLNVKLPNELSFAIAYRLKGKGIPFAFLTAYREDIIPGDLSSVPVISKPYCPSEVLRALAELVSPA